MIMKKLIAIFTLAFIAAGPARVVAQNNLESDPAYLAIDQAFDFKTVKPEVNINLPKFLLKDALADFDGGKDDPFAASGVNISDLIRDIKLIRVVVIEGQKTNSEAISQGVAKLRSSLEKNWTPITVVADGKEHVGVYAMGDAAGESTAGLALLIFDGKEAVIANVIGRVSLGKIMKVASRFDKIPKDFLKKLNGAAEKESAEKPKTPEKAAN